MDFRALWAKYQSMSPGEKAKVNAQIRAKWNSLSPAERQRVMSQLKAKWHTLSPAQKAKAMSFIRSNYSKLTPWQQARLRESFLGGQLQPSGMQLMKMSQAMGYSPEAMIKQIMGQLRRLGISLPL